MNQEDNDFLTTQQAAQFLGITDNRVRQLCKNGTLDAKKTPSQWHPGQFGGGFWLIDKQSACAYAANRPPVGFQKKKG